MEYMREKKNWKNEIKVFLQFHLYLIDIPEKLIEIKLIRKKKIDFLSRNYFFLFFGFFFEEKNFFAFKRK